MAKLVSKVYGDALFSLALEENCVDDLWEEVKVVKQTVSDNPDFLSVLTHPEMSQEKRLAVIDDIFKGKASDHMMGFLQVLVRKGRLLELVPVLEYFDSKAKEYKKIGVVKVSTPMPLTDDQKKQVEKRLLEVSNFETLEMDYSIDSALLGGMVIRIGDQVLDNSIQSKMNAMSRELFKVKL